MKVGFYHWCYEYPRYLFGNKSKDILCWFGDTGQDPDADQASR
jgi:hypothetical protein